MSAHSDDVEFGLGESTYELLSTSQIISDDEDGGSSVASLYSSNDDNVSLSGSDTSSRHHHIPQDHSPVTAFGGLEHHLHESGNTLQDLEEASEEIVFDEPEDTQAEQIEVSHKLRDFAEEEWEELRQTSYLDSKVSTNMFATIRQTMTTNESMALDEPLRVLYVGSPTAYEQIGKKLGAALVTPKSCSSSWDTVKSQTYSVFQLTSFGTSDRSPEVELVNNSYPQIKIDVCTSASKVTDRDESLSVWLNNTENVVSSYGENGIHLETADWQLPHLAVVFISPEDDSQARLTRLYARSFITRHDIPTLVITQNEEYYFERFEPDVGAVHICIESETEGEVSSVHKRLPIDLSSFLRLNALQLNRSLAVVTKLNSSASDDEILPAPTSRSASKLKGETPGSGPRVNISMGLDTFAWLRPAKKDNMWRLIFVSWFCFCSLVGGTFAVFYMKMSKAPIPEPVLSNFTPLSTVTAVSTKLFLQTQQTSVFAISPAPTSSSLSTVSAYVPLEEKFPDLKLEEMNSTDTFDIHVLGGNYIVLRPPQKYLQLKRAPRLIVDVTREGQPIAAELSKLFDGVYSLKVNDEDAWGKLNVSIHTKSKPYIKELLEVEFGNPWFKLSRWVKTLEQSKSELQHVLDSATADAREFIADFGHIAGQQALDVQQVLVDKAKDLSQEVKSELFRVAVSLRKNLEKARDMKEESVRVAQQQAKSLWEKRKESSRS